MSDLYSCHLPLSLPSARGVDKIALEASSHGLVQDRLNGIKMSIGVFTNLSRDHYDFHRNINSYFDAKLNVNSVSATLVFSKKAVP